MARGADPNRLSNPKREAFCQEFLVDLNATAAAARAGYSGRSSKAQGCRLMGFAEVQQRIQQLMATRAERTEITADRVLEELALCGFSDTRHYLVDEGGRLELDAAAPGGASRALASVKHKTRRGGNGDATWTEHEVEYRLWDKVAALAKLGQHLGMFVDRFEHTGKDGGPIEHRTTQTWEIGGRRIEF